MLSNSSLKVRWFKFSSLPIKLCVSHLLESILPVLRPWLQTNTRIKFKEKSCFRLSMGKAPTHGSAAINAGFRACVRDVLQVFQTFFVWEVSELGSLYMNSNKIGPEARHLLTLGNSFLGLRVRLLSPESAHVTGAGLVICCL